jgi:hypothetical protein
MQLRKEVAVPGSTHSTLAYCPDLLEVSIILC